jgi:hypothetical protein
MSRQASHLAHRLACNAEAVCRHYLSNGRRIGAYWLVGDVDNTSGRSLFVRLRGPESGRAAAGKWTDAATGQHGDLLDLIALSCGLEHLRDVLNEARRFLGLPHLHLSDPPAPTGSLKAAQRLLALSSPIAGTAAESYLRDRGITCSLDLEALRFHPRCYYRAHDQAPCEAWPALIAAVTDLSGIITGVQRTWLHPSGRGKAPVSCPRRALGSLLGNGVRFGKTHDVMVAGEGIETMLSLRSVLPTMPMVAALSASHLAAYIPSPELKRLYVARDADDAGRRAAEALSRRAQDLGIETLTLAPRVGDFNEDLVAFGAPAVLRALGAQLAPQDVLRFTGPSPAAHQG